MAPTNKLIAKNYQAKKFVEKQNQKVRKQYFKSQKSQGGPSTRNEESAATSHNFKPRLNFRTNHDPGSSSDQGKEQTKFKKHSKFQNALEELKQKKLEAQNKREETKKRKDEMSEALKRYQDKKAKKIKLLSKKTKKGQPIMKYWIENLLEQIQSGID